MRKQKIHGIYRHVTPPPAPGPVFFRLPGEKRFRELLSPETLHTRAAIEKNYGTVTEFDDWRPRGADNNALELENGEFVAFMGMCGGLIKWIPNPDGWGMVPDFELYRASKGAAFREDN